MSGKLKEYILSIKPKVFLSVLIALHILTAVVVWFIVSNNTVTIANHGLMAELFVIIFISLILSLLAVSVVYYRWRLECNRTAEKIAKLETEKECLTKTVNYFDSYSRELQNNISVAQTEVDMKRKMLKIYSKKLRIDHTQFKRLSNILLRNQRLIKKLSARAEVSDRYKSAFVACVSHEINTPIHGIIGIADMLCRPTLQPERRNEFTQNLSLSVKRFQDVFDNIMLYSKIQAGDLNITPQPFDVNFMLGSINMYADLLVSRSQKDIQIKFGCNFKEKKIITSYEEGIRIILLRLIGNAVKFSEKGRISIDYRITDTKVLFSVTDNGIGVPTDKYDEIFESFYQVDNNLSRTFSGLGLGLSICKGLLNLMDGRISVDSQIGEGSTFSFYVPASITPHSTVFSNEVLQATDLKPINKKMLVVTPDSKCSDLISSFLQRCSCVPILINSCENLVKIYKNNEGIELVILDLALNGVCIYAIQLLQLNISAKIIFLVPEDCNSTVIEQATAIGRGFVEKPLTDDKLLLALDSLLVLDGETITLNS